MRTVLLPTTQALAKQAAAKGEQPSGGTLVFRRPEMLLRKT